MPILVKDYTWIQTDKMINVRIPRTKNTYHENPDVFTRDTYIKVNFNPFLFEVFLLHETDSKKGSCIVKDEEIILDLVKKEPVEWERLEKDLTKAEKLKLRQEIIDKSVEESTQEKEDRRIKKSQLDRFTVQRAMDIDAKQHALMDSRREAEKAKAMSALEEWRLSNEDNPTPLDQKSLPPFRSYPFKNKEPEEKAKLNSGVTVTEISSKEEEDKVNITELPSEDEEAEDDSKPISGVIETELTSKNEGAKENPKPNSENKADKKISLKYVPPKNTPKPVGVPIRSEYIEKKKEELSKRVLPKLRNSGSVEITHTPRTFPTPSRESAHEEEQAWLKNITLARRATGFVSEDLRPEEQDPQWCKDKGDEFFRNGNFLGAISAYSHGISLSDKLPSLYSNRAATHFALGNFNKCMQDCSTALELLKPPCEGNRRSRAKCIARRAAALARCGYLHKAIQEMKVAQKILPEDENIKKDIYDMERAWEQNPDDG